MAVRSGVVRGGLQRRGEVWFARKRVPEDVRAKIGKREFTASLQTTDVREAHRLRIDLEAKWLREIEIARRGDGSIDLTDARMKIGSLVLAGWWHGRITTLDEDPWPPTWRRLLGADPSATTTAPPLALVIASLRHALASGDFRAVPGLEDVTREVLRRTGIVVGTDHPQWADLRAHVADCWLRALEASERDRLLGAYTGAVATLSDLSRPHAEALPIPVTAPAYAARIGDKTLGEVIAAYRAEQVAKRGEAVVKRDVDHVSAIVKELVGEATPIRAINRADIRNVREKIATIPANAKKRWPDLTALEAAEAATKDAPRLSPGSQRTYMIYLSAIMSFAVSEEWIERNPVSGLLPAKIAQVKRRGFTPEELGVVFGGLQAEREAGSWKWWLPALLLYSGARTAEIAQLRRTDIRETADGTLYLAISEFEESGRRAADKGLKTAASERFVPVHKALIKAGIADLREGEGDRVFPAIKKAGKDSYSHEPSKWFARHLDAVGLKDPALVLHSFRHGFADACRSAGVAEEHRKALGGWSATDEASRYGERNMIAVLKREIDRIAYGNFTLCP